MTREKIDNALDHGTLSTLLILMPAKDMYTVDPVKVKSWPPCLLCSPILPLG